MVPVMTGTCVATGGKLSKPNSPLHPGFLGSIIHKLELFWAY